jgi:hypothetical protein
LKDVNALLKTCEQELRAGKGARVARLLEGLNVARLAREQRLPLANVARRAGLTLLGLRLLGPVMHRDRNRWRTQPTSQELAEYAVLLQKCGANHEALQTLNLVDAGAVKEVHLYRSFCHFHRWDHAKAVPELKAYLECDLEPYARLVGQINLAVAHLYSSELEIADALLEQTLAAAAAGSYSRILGNGYELRAQTAVYRGDLSSASRYLEMARTQFDDEATFDQMFIRLWSAAIADSRAGRVEELRKFRADALAGGFWECAREADLFSLKIEFRRELFEHLIFGTPHSGGRAYICRQLGCFPQSTSYTYGEAGAPCFDLRSGKMTDGRETLNAGKKTHQLLDILLRDLYSPYRIGGLFAELYPKEYFDIETSPDRVHQVLRRARRWLDSARIPVEITGVDGTYRLQIHGRFAFQLPLHRLPRNSMQLQFERLSERFGEKLFSASEAREALGIRITSFNRLLTWALENGLLERSGRSTSTRYARTPLAKIKVAA